LSFEQPQLAGHTSCATSNVSAAWLQISYPYVQVLALVDDWGWANFGPHRTNATAAELEGSLETHTPNLNQLVKEVSL
jgi:hypothetical protein